MPLRRTESSTLLGMPNRTEEDRLARFVEKLWRHEMDREPGKPDYEPYHRGLTVDFIYPSASPPLALEITTLPSSQAKAAESAGDKTVASLDKAAKDEGLGRWELLWNTTDNVDKLREQALVVMRSGSPGGMSPNTGWWVRPIDSPEHGVQSAMIDHN